MWNIIDSDERLIINLESFRGEVRWSLRIGDSH